MAATVGALVPVGEARTVLPKAVQTHTHQIGLVLPPPDIRAVADKTAQFVARNGSSGPAVNLHNALHQLLLTACCPLLPVVACSDAASPLRLPAPRHRV